MNRIQRVLLGVSLIMVCIPLLFPVWDITYSNHAGLDRWSPDSSGGKPVQEQLWEQKSTQLLVQRRLVFQVPTDNDLKAKEIQRELSDTLKDIKEPVEQPWQFVSNVSGQVRQDRMVLEVLVVSLVGACLTLCAGLIRGRTEKR